MSPTLMLPLLLYFFFLKFLKSNFVSVSLHIAIEITSSYRTENRFYVLRLHHMGNTITGVTQGRDDENLAALGWGEGSLRCRA